ncbi:hypothetical protein I7I50_05732 [Histoplasma capsulatum G186AR]|uniref:Uncharacterized protein n=1 Tax=Ajellomyces capsulatus TaxID=5037 RepID=A0A8H8D7Y9_AJECA|nr:hypothetical protein I7I52_03992 [Histoplasma capsulatum]QSS76321.1 hypothetical protein I7I50_05732 [Histoplasma capsulatum G186AR]
MSSAGTEDLASSTMWMRTSGVLKYSIETVLRQRGGFSTANALRHWSDSHLHFLSRSNKLNFSLGLNEVFIFIVMVAEDGRR